MNFEILSSIITNFGLPIALAIVFGWFILKLFQFLKSQFIDNEKERMKTYADYVQFMKETQKEYIIIIKQNSEIMKQNSLIMKQLSKK